MRTFADWGWKHFVGVMAAAVALGTCFLALKQLPYVRTEFYETHLYDLIQMMINVPYALALVAFALAFRRLTTSKFLQFSGAISYELYLVHFPFYGALEGNLLYVAVFFVGSFAVAWMYKQAIAAIESNIQRMTLKRL